MSSRRWWSARASCAFGGERLGRAASAALLKIHAVLLPDLRERGRRTRIFAPELDDRIEASGTIDRRTRRSRCVGVAPGLPRQGRRIHAARSGTAVPVVLGRNLDAGAWCRLRRDFRSFRPTASSFSKRPARCSKTTRSAGWMPTCARWARTRPCAIRRPRRSPSLRRCRDGTPYRCRAPCRPGSSPARRGARTAA